MVRSEFGNVASVIHKTRENIGKGYGRDVALINSETSPASDYSRVQNWRRGTGSRFATVDEIESLPFNRISFQLEQIHHGYGLPDHGDVNRARYPWSKGFQGSPEIYAARLWEYPFAILEGEPEGKTCVDIGCGMSAFTLYLHSVGKAIGVDPELKKETKHLGHGVSQDFLTRTGLDVRQSSQELPSDHFDRVFCISVIEHVPRRKVRGLVREMARILKPGGLLVMTVDVNIEYDMARPMDLIWESGLVPKRGLDLAWPAQRLGRSDNLRSSADVYGLVLEKPVNTIQANYSPDITGLTGERINQSQIPLRRSRLESEVPMPLRVRRYLKAEWLGR